jgi:hypothetical protein
LPAPGESDRQMKSTETASIADDRKRQRVRLAKLEADVAYFQARMEMIGQPGTSNQLAQVKVFKLLHKASGAKILKLRTQASEMI